MKLWKIRGETHRSAPKSKQIVFTSPMNLKPTKTKSNINGKGKKVKSNVNRCSSAEEKENSFKTNIHLAPKCSASKILFSDEIKKASGTKELNSIIKNASKVNEFSMKKKGEGTNVTCQNSSEFLQFKTKKSILEKMNYKKTNTSRSPSTNKDSSPSIMNSMLINPCFSPMSTIDHTNAITNSNYTKNSQKLGFTIGGDADIDMDVIKKNHDKVNNFNSTGNVTTKCSAYIESLLDTKNYQGNFRFFNNKK